MAHSKARERFRVGSVQCLLVVGSRSGGVLCREGGAVGEGLGWADT